MTRDTLLQILNNCQGVAPATEAHGFEVAQGHRLTLFLGEPGSAMALTDVAGLRLQPEFVEARTRESETLYVGYDAVHALRHRTGRGGDGGRAGFG
ncbi:MAG: hypothetical protein MJD61_18025 [Proteobacteria bacterium]|nr:hypothetical protein [Pseudomonadota bacterium]